MPDEILGNLGLKVDKLIDAVQTQSIKIGILEGKLDEANDRINIVNERIHELHSIVMRREGANDGVEEVRRDLSTKFMWCLGYCTALCGVIIALFRSKLL